MTAERLVSPRNIGVLHAKELGDLIATLPALTAIKETYPEANLTLLTTEWAKDFLSVRPSPIDTIIAVPKSAGFSSTTAKREKQQPKSLLKESPELALFYGEMQARHFDAVIHLQGVEPAADHFISLLGAKLTAGVSVATPQVLNLTLTYAPCQNEVLRNLEVAGLIGARTTNIDPRIGVTQKDEREIADIIGSFGGEPFVVLHTGASDRRKLWSPLKFAAVADACAEKGFRVILTGAPTEKPMITEIIQYMKHMALAQTSLSFGGLAALLAGAAIVVGNDTGPLRLARAVGAKTVGIFWAPHFLRWGPFFSAHHRSAISWRLECPKCGTKLVPPPLASPPSQCDHAVSLVENIPIAEVISYVSELLEDRPHAST